MSAPRYQDIEPEAIPTARLPHGVETRVVAGRVGEVEGPVTGVVTEPVYLDVRMPAGASFEHALPASHTAFLYVYEGAVRIGGEPVARGALAVLSEGEDVAVTTDGEAARFILVAGKPLREPVAKYGPFVMNTEAEIRQAVADYRSGRF